MSKPETSRKGLSDSKKRRFPLLVSLMVIGALSISSVFVFDFFSPSLEERAIQLNESSPVSDDELDLELFTVCMGETDFYTDEVFDDMLVAIEDLGGGYEAIAVAATRGSLAAANKELRAFPDYAPGFGEISGQFSSAPHCGSATLESYNNQLANVASEIERDVGRMASKVSELGPEYDRVIDNLNGMSSLSTDLGVWLVMMELDI
jgi:hypothetical protein